MSRPWRYQPVEWSSFFVTAVSPRRPGKGAEKVLRKRCHTNIERKRCHTNIEIMASSPSDRLEPEKVPHEYRDNGQQPVGVGPQSDSDQFSCLI